MGLFALLVLLVMLNFTAPLDIGPLGVLVFFTMIYVFVFGVFLGIEKMFRGIFGKKGKISQKELLCVVIASFGPIMLLLMRAFEMLSIASSFLVILFVFLSCFLVNKKF